MVWSAGPDGKIDPNPSGLPSGKANQGVQQRQRPELAVKISNQSRVQPSPPRFATPRSPESRVQRRRTVDCGLRTVDCGPRTVDCGPRTVDCGPRTVDCGPRTVDCGPRTVDCGPRTVDCGPRTVDCGPRTVDCGPRTVDCGPRTVDCGPRTVDCGPRTGNGESAFTLIELLVVISILGIMAALTVPVLKNFAKSDATLGASRQLLDDVARARQLAISQRTTVYMVFVPANFWYAALDEFSRLDNGLTPAELTAAVNLCDKQLTGYIFVSLRSVGDQPGQGVPHYLAPWQTLPDSTFIALAKFTNSPTNVTPSPIPFPARRITFTVSSYEQPSVSHGNQYDGFNPWSPVSALHRVQLSWPVDF